MNIVLFIVSAVLTFAASVISMKASIVAQDSVKSFDKKGWQESHNGERRARVLFHIAFGIMLIAGMLSICLNVRLFNW